jgi:soluble P-type ATPase
MKISIPGRATYDIGHVALDMNGTIGLDGALMEGVADRLALLSTMVRLVILTADTHGGASRVRDDLGLETVILKRGGEAEQKLAFIRRLGAEHSVAIGNGSNDILMLKESAIGICVVGIEGASTAALLAADIVVTDICDALDLLLKPQRLVATLRM